MKKHLLSLFIASFSLLLGGCGNNTPIESSVEPEKTLESIAVSGDYRTVYLIDEEFDDVGIIVTATYSDTSTARIKNSLVTFTGFDSSKAVESLPITVSYTEKEITKTTSFNVSIIEDSEDPKVTVNLEVTVKGIEVYESFHSLMYINGTFVTDGSNWTTKVLTQDASNKDLWTTSFEEIAPNQYYDFNIYFGDSNGANFTYGKNTEFAEKDTAWSKLVDLEAAVDGVVTLVIEATFVVPDLSSVTVDVIVDASVIESEGAEATALPEKVYVWAWNNATNSTVRFELGEDAKWHKELEVSIDANTSSGTLACSFVLGTADAANWNCYGGEWESGVFTKWESVERTVTLESTSVEYTAHFKDVPYIAPEGSASLTISYTPSEGSTFGGACFQTSSSGEWTSDSAWAGDFTANNGTYTYKYTPVDDNLNLRFTIKLWYWASDTDKWDAYVTYDSSWHLFNVSFEGEAVINLTTDAVTSGAAYVGSVTSSTGVTINAWGE